MATGFWHKSAVSQVDPKLPVFESWLYHLLYILECQFDHYMLIVFFEVKIGSQITKLYVTDIH